MDNTKNNNGKKSPDGYFEYISKQELDDFKAGRKSKEKKYNLTISPAYAMKYGFWSLNIDARAFDALQKVELGGKLVFKVKPQQTNNTPSSDDIDL